MGVLQPELIDARTSSPPLPPLLSGRIHLRTGMVVGDRLQLGLSCTYNKLWKRIRTSRSKLHNMKKTSIR